MLVALLVSACDKLHNARSIVADIRTIGEEVFDRFSATHEQTIWYYRRLAGVFKRQLRHDRLVRLLEYEIASMTDFGIPNDATSI